MDTDEVICELSMSRWIFDLGHVAVKAVASRLYGTGSSSLLLTLYRPIRGAAN
jgi:hypothetical protein